MKIQCDEKIEIRVYGGSFKKILVVNETLYSILVLNEILSTIYTILIDYGSHQQIFEVGTSILIKTAFLNNKQLNSLGQPPD